MEQEGEVKCLLLAVVVGDEQNRFDMFHERANSKHSKHQLCPVLV